MKKKILFLSLAALGITFNFNSFAQLNLTFRSQLTFAGDLSNIWGYASAGKEYALVGHQTGMSVVNVTDPAAPALLFTAPGPNSIWREVRSKGTYAFVTTEGGGGLQIVNLAYLPDSIQKKNWTGDGAIAGQLDKIHALQVDGNYLYLYGSNIQNAQSSGHPLIIDVTDPWDPHYAGGFVFPGPGSVSYVHDGYVRNDTGYFGHIYDGFFSIVDLTDKANPVLLASQNTPGNFTHNSWLSDNSQVLFTTDEVDNSYLTAYNVTDPSDIEELDKIQINPGSNSVVHNTYVLNDYAVTSWYKEGVVIVDASRPDNLIITGYYDTSPLSGGGMDGDWGVYPFLPSGNLLISDIQEGLFVLTPGYKRGCYLEGNITESGSGNPLFNASVTIVSTSETSNSKSTGNYACGYAIPGTYSVKVQKTGYLTKIINGVTLTSGVVTSLNVQLDLAVAFALSGLVKENSSGPAIANAEVLISTAFVSYSITADANGFFTLPNMYADTYQIQAGQWGYLTKCYDQFISSSSGGLLVELEKGFYDDFTFDFGWAISSTASAGIWEIGEPLGTTNGNDLSNPDLDADSDCSDRAFITGNAGGSAGDDDVDNGKTTITSPLFDISSYSNAYISYSRWFYNGGGQGTTPNDSLKIKLNNGSSTVTLENVLYNSPGNSSWISASFRIADFISITPNMKMIVETGDNTPGHLVEAGFDFFRILDSAALSTVNKAGEIDFDQVNIYPNPSKGIFELRIPGESNDEVQFDAYNVLGEIISKSNYSKGQSSYIIDLSKQPSGMYFVNIKANTEKRKTIRIVKF